MIRMKIVLILMAMIIGISFLSGFGDNIGEKPAILGGKIWSGSDTIDIGKKEMRDSLVSDETTKDDDFFSGSITELAARKVSADADILRLKLSIPRTLKFIDEAPVVLKAKSSDPDIVEIGEGAGQNPEKGFIFPITVNPGEADIYLYYRVVCCTTGGREACFFKEARLKVPIEAGDFEDSVIVVRHEIDN